MSMVGGGRKIIHSLFNQSLRCDYRFLIHRPNCKAYILTNAVYFGVLTCTGACLVPKHHYLQTEVDL